MRQLIRRRQRLARQASNFPAWTALQQTLSAAISLEELVMKRAWCQAGRGFGCLLTICLINVAATRRTVAEEGILVSGTGETMVKPSQLELYLTAAGEAELGSDAVVKYHQAISRTLEAFEGLKVPNLKLESRGLGVSTSGMTPAAAARMGVEAGQVPAAQVMLSRNMRVVVAGIDKLPEDDVVKLVSKLIDTARDMGIHASAAESSAVMEELAAQQGPQPAVQFVAENVEKQRETAYRQAFEQARQRAQRLATIAGVKLGEVKSVEEARDGSGDETVQEAYLAAVYGAASVGRRGDSRVSSPKFSEIPVVVTLRVRFAIVPGAK
jgi:uncharacterized protein YggE